MQNIPFKTNLPAEPYNDYNLGEVGLPCLLCTNDLRIKLLSLEVPKSPSWARFILKLRQIIASDRRQLVVDGQVLSCSINWIRDHVHQMKGYKHWEHDLKSYLEFIIRNQHKDGFFYEIAVVGNNAHLKFVDEYFTKHFPDDHVGLVRLQLEADVEYLIVEGAVSVYKATGDDEWIKQMLPYLEKGIEYMTSHPDRWDKEHGLVKRTFSIDTWDFTYGYSGNDRNIHPESPMSIMHGDNSGVYQAMNQLAWLNRRFGNEEKAAEWENKACKLKENLDKYCWNGNFYTHQYHLNHKGAECADETKILSLSNAYDMNRGITTPEQTEAIISEYIRRRDEVEAFAEWFSIDPPYEKFDNGDGYWGKYQYINGGIGSFTAGELAKAAFNNGFEEYGWDILCRLRDLMFEHNGELYFLYNPLTKENIAGGPSGWGAAAIMSAVDDGLAGIKDLDVCYNAMEFAPRWAITDMKEIRYITGYEVSKCLIETLYRRTEEGLHYELRTPSESIKCHILLPIGEKCKELFVNGEPYLFTSSKVRNSNYIDFDISNSTSTIGFAGWKKTAPIDIQIVFENV